MPLKRSRWPRHAFTRSAAELSVTYEVPVAGKANPMKLANARIRNANERRR
jgi:hypothetical protein